MRSRAFVLMVTATFVLAAAIATAQTNRIDLVTPSAPELASYGQHDIGVRTIVVSDTNRPDILNTKEGGPTARYDRALTLEIWYPAALAAGQKPGGDYTAITRDPAVAATLHGKAVRDAAPLGTGSAFPLVIISHGYPGNRYLLSHLGENLASKGFVVASIDHKDSTYDDQKAFASTLYNRPFDQLFVLNEMARLGRPGSNSFLSGLVDASHAGIVGYSMGGYGVVNVVGGGYSKASETFAGAPPNRLLAERGAATPEYQKSIDPRIKAAIAIAPWGMPAGFWDAEGLKGIRTPIMFVAGSVDDVAGYEKGPRAIYQAAVNADRYLLTFVNANHNAAAPIPAPAETYAYSEALKSYPFAHYADAVWDTARMNNILDHFATAYFERYLKGDRDRQAYLDLIPNAKDGVYAMDKDGKPTPAHTYWKGFKAKTAVGLTLEHTAPAASAPFDLPAPTGRLAVGTTNWQVTNGERLVGVHAWYPTANNGEAAPYLRDGMAGVRSFATALGGAGLLDDLAAVKTHAALDAPPMPEPAALPLLVFSHGYTAEPSAYTVLLEDLASHGYAVLSIVHPYGAEEPNRVMAEWKTEDATMASITATTDEAEQMRLMRGYLSAIPLSTAVVNRWAADTRAVLAGLSKLAPGTAAARLAARVDVNRLGVFGHSMGGVVAAQFCLEDRRCKAGLNLDGIPQYGSVIDGRLASPFLMVYSSRPGRSGASDVIYRRAASPYYRAQVNGTSHLDFCDMAFWGPLRDRKAVGPIDAARAAEITRAIVREYFDQELRGKPSPLLSGARTFPEVTVATLRPRARQKPRRQNASGRGHRVPRSR